MAIQLNLRTGDVTATPPCSIEFSLRKTNATGPSQIEFKGARAEFSREGWRRFVEVVRGREPARWRSERSLPALAGLPDAHALLKLTTTTPSYQLLLAGVDLALAIRVVEDEDEEAVLQRFADLSEGLLPSFTGSGGLFILPRDLILPEASADVEDLLSESKLGRATVSNQDEQVVRFYIPYAVPIGVDTTSPSARRLWEEVRNYYYGLPQKVR